MPIIKIPSDETLLSTLKISLEQFWKALSADNELDFLNLHYPKEFLEIQNENNLTPLLFAAQTGKKLIVQILLQEGANSDAKNSLGLNALMLAAYNGHTEIVDLLVKFYDVDEKDKQDMTALSWSSHAGYARITKFLFESKANPEMKNREGRTPLALASLQGHTSVVEQLLSFKADVNTKDLKETAPLALAASNGHRDLVEFLASHGAEVEAKDVQKTTALGLAIMAKHATTVETLLSLKSNPEFLVDTQKQRTPLAFASMKGDAKTVNVLLSRKGESEVVELERKDIYGLTALALAVYFNHAPVVELLFKAGASKETTDLQRNTLLHHAASQGAKEALFILMKADVNINAQNAAGRTPLQLAAAAGHKDIVEFLKLKEQANLLTEKVLQLEVSSLQSIKAY